MDDEKAAPMCSANPEEEKAKGVGGDFFRLTETHTPIKKRRTQERKRRKKIAQQKKRKLIVLAHFFVADRALFCSRMHKKEEPPCDHVPVSLGPWRGGRGKRADEAWGGRVGGV